ncbi:MAG: SRPBCC family protein [Verrucomicrobiae bacterium]|nr:SRPBCC family protein [Verrucomicrobiae bacterium]
MIKKILLVLAAIVVLFVIVVALQPADFRVERSASIAAPPGELFDQVNDHKKFQKWNPWDKMDPEAKTTFSGADSGVGAVASWDGAKVGVGSATIIESKPGELVRQRMDWVKPMEGTSTVDFTFKAEGDKTVVTWAMYGKNGFMGKAMSLFISCEKMCGPEFEKGLGDLASIVADKDAN